MQLDTVRRGAGARVFFLGLALAVTPLTAGSDDPARHLDRARSSLAAGDLGSAPASLEAYVEQVPGSAESWLSLGQVRFARQQFDGAAEALERSIGLDAVQPRAFKTLGRVQTARGEAARAERAFVEAARLDPGDAEARYLLGRLYQSEGRLVEAARFLEAAVEIDPGAVRALAFLGSVHYGLGDPSRAEELLRRAVRLTEGSAAPETVPHLELGVLLQRTGRLEESVAQLRRAVELDASNAGAGFELGRSLHRLGRLEEAAAALRAALAVDGGDPRVHYLLGRVCYEQGDRACGDRHMALSEGQRGR